MKNLSLRQLLGVIGAIIYTALSFVNLAIKFPLAIVIIMAFVGILITSSINASSKLNIKAFILITILLAISQFALCDIVRVFDSKNINTLPIVFSGIVLTEVYDLFKRKINAKIKG